jgi:DNA repair protein RadA/Sms
MLQVCLGLGNFRSLYISGEESEQQIRLRAERIGLLNKQCYILAETSAEVIIKHIQDIEPVVVVVDSIQTLASELLDSGAGSVSQIRECAALMLKFAKEAGIPIILVGHITKDGSLAGPKILEHMVDTVLQFEGDRNYGYRILRAVKNRFGSTSELGIFEMMGSGLREVSNPSELLLSSREEELSGSATAAAVEGLRPMLIEIQSLVSTAAYGTPQRSATGFDVRRLNMLLAVLEKRCGFRLGIKDVFLNIAGGIKVDDPAIDLAVIAAILSSNEDIAVEQNVALAAEIGLSGELRPVSRIEQRISEAEKMGFKAIILSKYNFKNTENMPSRNIEVVALSKVDDVFSYLFG